MRTAPLALTAALALTLAACGSSSPPPTAGQIARKLPGCHKTFPPVSGVPVQAKAAVSCITRTAEVTVATFTSASLERQWITGLQAGACGSVQGSGWAAEVMATVSDLGCPVEASVAKALGGRVVTG